MELDENPNRVFFLKIVKIMPFIFGLLIMGIGVFLFSFNANFLTNSNTVVGEISSYNEVLRIDRTEEIQRTERIMYQATISYIVNNEEYHFSPSAYTRSAPKIGMEIKVYYLIENPWEAKLASELFLFPAIPVILGIIIICVNLFIYIKRRTSSH